MPTRTFAGFTAALDRAESARSRGLGGSGKFDARVYAMPIVIVKLMGEVQNALSRTRVAGARAEFKPADRMCFTAPLPAALAATVLHKE